MNLKSLFIATIISSQTEAALSPNDYTHVEKVQRQGKTAIRINLTQSGLDKIEAQGNFHLPNKLTFEVRGKFYSFKARSSVIGDEIEVGPFSQKEASKIARELTV